MPEDSIEETNSGVRKEGDLEEIAEFAREVEDVMKEEDAREDSIEKFEDWRPREDDQEEDIKRKTVKAASIPEKRMEKDSNGVKDVADAGEKAIKAGKKIGKRENPGKDVKDASKKFVQPFYSLSARVTRNIEEKVYSDLMLKFNPYFFDTEDFSADLRSKKNEYVIDVDVADKSSRESLKERMAGKE